jgi:hypothetical protein
MRAAFSSKKVGAAFSSAKKKQSLGHREAPFMRRTHIKPRTITSKHERPILDDNKTVATQCFVIPELCPRLPQS